MGLMKLFSLHERFPKSSATVVELHHSTLFTAVHGLKRRCGHLNAGRVAIGSENLAEKPGQKRRVPPWVSGQLWLQLTSISAHFHCTFVFPFQHWAGSLCDCMTQFLKKPRCRRDHPQHWETTRHPDQFRWILWHCGRKTRHITTQDYRSNQLFHDTIRSPTWPIWKESCWLWSQLCSQAWLWWWLHTIHHFSNEVNVIQRTWNDEEINCTHVVAEQSRQFIIGFNKNLETQSHKILLSFASFCSCLKHPTLPLELRSLYFDPATFYNKGPGTNRRHFIADCNFQMRDIRRATSYSRNVGNEVCQVSVWQILRGFIL